MPNFNSKESAEKYVQSVYEARAQRDAADVARKEADARAERAEQRADKSIRQNQKLLIATIVLGACGLVVDLLANLDAIIRNIALLLPPR